VAEAGTGAVVAHLCQLDLPEGARPVRSLRDSLSSPIRKRSLASGIQSINLMSGLPQFGQALFCRRDATIKRMIAMLPKSGAEIKIIAKARANRAKPKA